MQRLRDVTLLREDSGSIGLSSKDGRLDLVLDILRVLAKKRMQTAQGSYLED